MRQTRFLILVVLTFLYYDLLAQSEFNPCGSEDLYGYCDASGKYVIEPKFQKAHPFEGNLAGVAFEGSLWMLDKKGTLKFNTRLYPESDPPVLEKGLFKVEYFDPIFANVTEYYNRKGQPVKVLPGFDNQADTMLYSLFNANAAIEWAKTKLGTPYGMEGLDCSGFIRFIFNGYGIVLPYYAKEMALRGEEVTAEKARSGDLIFFTGANPNDKTPNHVGFVTKRSGPSVEFIHTSTSKGVTINKSTDPYYKARFLTVRRIFD